MNNLFTSLIYICRQDQAKPKMSFARSMQIVGAYAAVTVTLTIITFAAKSDDKTVYVMFFPWVASEEVNVRVAASGGRTLPGSSYSAIRVAVSDRSTLERLYSHGAALIVTSAPAQLCVSGGVAAR